MKKILIFIFITQSLLSFSQTSDCDTIVLKNGIIRYQSIVELSGSRITVEDCEDEEKKYMWELENIKEIRFAPGSEKMARKISKRFEKVVFQPTSKKLKQEKKMESAKEFKPKSQKKSKTKRKEKQLPDIPEWKPKYTTNSKYSLTVGTGFPDYINLGFRMKMNQFEHGLEVAYFGAASVSEYFEKDYQSRGGSLLSYNLYLHFGSRKSWYSKFGAGYSKHKKSSKIFSGFESDYEVTRVNLTAGIGQEFEVSKHHAIGVDMGFLLPIYTASEAYGYLQTQYLSIVPLIDFNLFWKYNF